MENCLSEPQSQIYNKHFCLFVGSACAPFIPVVVLLAVDATVLAEAGELGLQVEFALAALEAAHVPLFVHGQQVVSVRDLPPTAGAQRDTLAGHARHRLRVNTGREARTQRQSEHGVTESKNTRKASA